MKQYISFVKSKTFFQNLSNTQIIFTEKWIRPTSFPPDYQYRWAYHLGPRPSSDRSHWRVRHIPLPCLCPPCRTLPLHVRPAPSRNCPRPSTGATVGVGCRRFHRNRAILKSQFFVHEHIFIITKISNWKLLIKFIVKFRAEYSNIITTIVSVSNFIENSDKNLFMVSKKDALHFQDRLCVAFMF